jgi:hypothetical protein
MCKVENSCDVPILKVFLNFDYAQLQRFFVISKYVEVNFTKKSKSMLAYPGNSVLL